MTGILTRTGHKVHHGPVSSLTRLVPPLPVRVAVDPDHVVHRTATPAVTGCYRWTGDMTVGNLADDARHKQYRWCDNRGCFPGLRCQICGVPSGGHTECLDCMRADHDREKATAGGDT